MFVARTRAIASSPWTLTPDLLVVLLLFMVGDGHRRGYRHILDAFWDQCASHGVPLPTEKPVSASAFSQARGKLPDEGAPRGAARCRCRNGRLVPFCVALERSPGVRRRRLQGQPATK